MAIGELLIAASIKFLFQKLATLAFGELSNFARGFGGERRIRTLLTKWSRTLEEIEAVLVDADEKQVTERGITIWLEDLQDLSYDVDDILEEFSTEALRPKLMITTKEYYDLLHEFMTAVKQNYGEKVLIQFEDFANHNAFELLAKYSTTHLVFNDDIQGTATVVLAGLVAALKLLGRSLAEQTFLFLGAGEVVWLKIELCRLLEEKRSGTSRAEELETALMEMVKQDNRRQLSARVEQLEQEVADLRQALADKKEQENAMLQVLMRVEQEQKLTEDARVFAEQDAAAQRYVVHVLQEKHEKTMALLTQMEKRVIAAESMLEGTLQYGHGQVKAQSSPRSMHPDSPREVPTRKIGLLSFGLSWRDRNKGKPTNIEEPGLSKLTSEGMSPSIRPSETNSQQDQEN